MCQSVRWVLSHETSWTLYRSQSSTDLHQTCHQGRVPRDVVTYCFCWKFEGHMSDKTGSGINCHHCKYWKIALMSNISKTMIDTMLGLMEVEYETAAGLSIGIMTFDLGWPWTILDLGHRTCTSNILNAVRNAVLDTIEMVAITCTLLHNYWTTQCRL